MMIYIFIMLLSCSLAIEITDDFVATEILKIRSLLQS